LLKPHQRMMPDQALSCERRSAVMPLAARGSGPKVSPRAFR
jgi:hypothetical protein